MHPNATLIEQFYQAFAQHDAVAMNACYHPEIVFSDPVFRELQGDRARAMWQMLVRPTSDLVLTFRDVTADDQQGSASWEANYTFSQTGRKVLNKVHSVFHFQDGKIRVQRDSFDLWRWSRLALGGRGTFLGWTPLVQNAIHASAIKGLDAFVARQQAGG